MGKIKNVKIGILGGSGFYDFLGNARKIAVKTPFGNPSDKITVGEYKGRKVAFLPRHGRRHQFPPHKIPYLANLYAFKKMGIERIIAPAAVGSLKPKIKPADFVICDQFVNFARKRNDSYFNGKNVEDSTPNIFSKVAHISSADPYCSNLRGIAFKAGKDLRIPVLKKGTIVVIEGPRFSSRAESNFFSSLGDVVNMTVYPELILARELEMCYVNIALVTDYDVGLERNKNIKPVSAKEVVKIFKENNEKVKKLIFKIIENISEERNCACKNAIANAFIN
jgi:5'-methylthioadenosine phosphorylase